MFFEKKAHRLVCQNGPAVIPCWLEIAVLHSPGYRHFRRQTLPVWRDLARPERFELPTYWFEASCSIRLSYGRVWANGNMRFVSADGIETEIKLRVPDVETARNLLEQNGFTVSVQRLFESNSVCDTSARDLKTRGELLRLRLAGERSVLTWKGPEQPGRHKSRPETEVAVGDFEECRRLLENLGYALVFRYDKYRTEYVRRGTAGVATLDETPIGIFVELEGTAEWIDRAASELGFSPADYITRSYGSLYFEFCENHGIPPGFMTFFSQEKS